MIRGLYSQLIKESYGVNNGNKTLTVYKGDNLLLERKRVIIGDYKAINNFNIDDRAALLFILLYLSLDDKNKVYK